MIPAEDSQSTEQVTISQVLEEKMAQENQETTDLDNADLCSEAMGPQEEEASNSGENPLKDITAESAT